MNSSVTRDFRELLGRLPSSVQEEAGRAYLLWQRDQHHPGLAFKRVSQRQPIYSVRIGIGHRALGLSVGDRIYWFWIGTHADYDGLLRRL
ncbi:MAG: hypothetical protein EXR58_05495 [Chloroflexi bacterium]|nr:hypothetical protein [Chloroflexota bacterium]